MRRLVYLIVFLLLSVLSLTQCNSKKARYSLDFVERYCYSLDSCNSINNEYLVLELNDSSFFIAQNVDLMQIGWAMLENDKFNSYFDYLFSLMNHQDRINFDHEFYKTRIYHYTIEQPLRKEATLDFYSFKNNYLVYYPDDNLYSISYYEIKEEFLSIRDQIATLCFENGMFVDMNKNSISGDNTMTFYDSLYLIPKPMRVH